MFRATGTKLCSEMQKQKMGTLYKILAGDVQFKNKAAVKDSAIVSVFGNDWKSELNAWYATEVLAKLDAADKKAAQGTLDRMIARLAITRYTNRELASFAAGGVHSIDAYAQADMKQKAADFIAENGKPAFDTHVAAEAKNANWDAATVDAFKKAASA
eukprot:TRINITY_DN1983_c1_g1_i1.p1 TRINITY_DN1983_c1_g1~~TRINITY_DN1983_c1_g1_i1.p1  ORF type:complete len:158 (+),score=45.87 TRINITY_DN1983_c1_g1_i1:55-528(+)